MIINSTEERPRSEEEDSARAELLQALKDIAETFQAPATVNVEAALPPAVNIETKPPVVNVEARPAVNIETKPPIVNVEARPRVWVHKATKLDPFGRVLEVTSTAQDE